MAKETDRVATMADCLTHERGGSLGTIFRVRINSLSRTAALLSAT